jgi:hypothetical protein
MHPAQTATSIRSTVDSTALTQFRLGELAEPIGARTDDATNTGAAQIARRDLGRYYAVMHAELRRIQATVTPSEALLICDALNGTLVGADTAQHLHAEIADAIDLAHLDEKWQVNGPKLLDLIDGWTPAQRMAVCDAVQQWWKRGAADGYEPSLRAVGLLPPAGSVD